MLRGNTSHPRARTRHGKDVPDNFDSEDTKTDDWVFCRVHALDDLSEEALSHSHNASFQEKHPSDDATFAEISSRFPVKRESLLAFALRPQDYRQPSYGVLFGSDPVMCDVLLGEGLDGMEKGISSVHFGLTFDWAGAADVRVLMLHCHSDIGMSLNDTHFLKKNEQRVLEPGKSSLIRLPGQPGIRLAVNPRSFTSPTASDVVAHMWIAYDTHLVGKGSKSAGRVPLQVQSSQEPPPVLRGDEGVIRYRCVSRVIHLKDLARALHMPMISLARTLAKLGIWPYDVSTPTDPWWIELFDAIRLCRNVALGQASDAAGELETSVAELASLAVDDGADEDTPCQIQIGCLPALIENLYEKWDADVQVGRPEAYVKIQELLGGSSSKTIAVSESHRSKVWTARVFPRRTAEQQRRCNLFRARAILPQAHEHLLGVYDAFMTDDTLHIISPHTPLQSLASHVSKDHPMEELVARFIATQLISAIAYLHGMKKAHGSVKPNNVMLFRKAPIYVKLGGYGIVHENYFVEGSSPARVRPGVSYWAPEMWQHDPLLEPPLPSDIWSLGCTLFFFLSGQHAFTGRWADRDGVTSDPAQFSMYYHKPDWTCLDDKLVSESCLLFLEGCFERDPAQRPTIKELAKDPWFSENLSRVAPPLPKPRQNRLQELRGESNPDPSVVKFVLGGKEA